MDTWTTREGEEIKICDMTDPHLLNTIKFLRKRISTLPDEVLVVVDAEDAVMDYAVNTPKKTYQTLLQSMYNELTFRHALKNFNFKS